MEILNLLNHQLVKLLTSTLPRLDPDWWNCLVLEKLTYQQKAFATSLPLQGLERLDLAASLRVADQNLHRIADEDCFKLKIRNWFPN